jgi:hypothetical protein
MHKINNKLLIFFFGYLFFMLGFFLNENSSGGALPDYNHHFKVMLSFKEDLRDSLINYHIFKTDHSPLFIYSLLIIYNLLENEFFLRFLYSHLGLLVPFLLFKCLKLEFQSISTDKLLLFSFVILLSPFLRSLSYWPGSEIISLIFLLISIYFYLNFKKNNRLFHNVFLNIFFLAVSAYYKPVFSIFSLFFFYEFFKILGISKKLFLIMILNIFLSLPAFYFLFFVNDYLFKFMSSDSSIYYFNIANIILIVTSIIFFHLLFLSSHIYFEKKLFFSTFGKFQVILILLFVFLLSIYFNFDVNQLGYGGGFFLKISNLFFKNNYLFYFVCFFGMILILNLIKINFYKHLVLIICLFLQNPHNYFYHEYFEPLILIVFLTLFDRKLSVSYFNKNLNLISLYLFYTLFFLMNLIKNTDIFLNNVIN